jgi:hypothetical protein
VETVEKLFSIKELDTDSLRILLFTVSNELTERECESPHKSDDRLILVK